MNKQFFWHLYSSEKCWFSEVLCFPQAHCHSDFWRVCLNSENCYLSDEFLRRSTCANRAIFLWYWRSSEKGSWISPKSKVGIKVENFLNSVRAQKIRIFLMALSGGHFLEMEFELRKLLPFWWIAEVNLRKSNDLFIIPTQLRKGCLHEYLRHQIGFCKNPIKKLVRKLVFF